MNRLSDELEHTTSGARLFLMLALVLVAVVGVNAWAIQKSPASVRTFEGHMVKTKWDLASEGVPAGGIAVVGDSSGNFAVVADTLGNALGVPARNYCTYGRFLVEGAGWFLDRAIENAEGPPSLALVVLGSRTLILEPSGFTFAQIPMDLGGWSDRAPRTGMPALQVAAFAAARVFPLYAQHRSFERGFRKDYWEIDPARLPIQPSGDSIILRAYPDGVGPFADRVLGELAAWQGDIPGARDRAAFQGLIADAETRGYDIVFVDGPIWSGLESNPDHRAFLAKFHAYLDPLCDASERAWHLPGPLQTFDAAVMENPFHLTREPAERFTAELAARLKALGLPR